MKLTINDSSLSLYLRHICIEIFKNEFYSDNYNVDVSVNENTTSVTAEVCVQDFSHSQTEYFSFHPSKNIAKTTAVGKCVTALGEKLGFKKSPYGVLTGVRPIKVALPLIGENKETAQNTLFDRYLISKEKSDLLLSCAKYDALVKKGKSFRDVSIYISIPFCPSRCYYCSFVSYGIEKHHKLIPSYLGVLFSEIERISALVKRFSLRVKSIYIGGGTPGVLSEEETKLLFESILKNFDVSNLAEFCYEIGRPDTVTREKLVLAKSFGVTRVSINTQTTNDRVLEKIGRHHTALDFFNAIKLAQELGFNSINTDLIAGLDGDDLESFKRSVGQVIETGVNNITVHALSLKKSSDIKTSGHFSLEKESIDSFLHFSKNACISNGFEPYYLYRQKYALGNHESVGYCKDGTYSHYNIAMMNEAENVLGIGAGATSRIEKDNSYIHFANYKYPHDYITDTKKSIKEIEKMSNIFSKLIGEQA